LCTGEKVLKWEHNHPIWSVAFSPNGRQLACAGGESVTPVAIQVWDLATSGEPLVLRGHTGCVERVVFSPDGRRLASAGSDRRVRIWDAATGDELLPLRGHNAPVCNVTFSPDGRWLVSGSALLDPEGKLLSGEMKLWDPSTGQEAINLRGHGQQVNKIAFSADGRRLASASNDHTVKVWDVGTGRETLTPCGHTGRG